jgi:uncharacterized ion transporter superfamily protein YfcC
MMRRMPDTLVIILGFMILFTLLTWLVPAGAFERTLVGGREVLVPGSYHRVEAAPQGLGSFLTAPIKGFISAAEIVAFVFLVGGAFGILTETGAITSGLQRIIGWSRHRPRARKLIVPLLMVLFSLAGATFGMSEEVLVFILISIPLAEAMGYDSLVGVAIPFIGAGAGFAGAFSNPFTIGIAQGIAELPPFSGMGYRLIVWVVLTTAAILYIMRYIRQLETGKAKGLHTRPEAAAEANTPIPFTTSRKLIIFLFIASLGLLVYGVSKWSWYIEEIAGLFIGLGLAAALLARLPMAKATTAFTHGARDMMTAGLVIALSKGLLIIAQEGQILDTILYAFSSSVENFPKALSIEVMFLVQTFLNFFIPSGSGQAALTMPIMAPLSDLLGITRQTAVLAFQLGDGLSNLIIPTSGVTMGVLAIGKIPYDRWLRWAGPLILILFLLAGLLLLPPVLLFHYGPF